jgi:hypothetical protein
MLQSVLPMLASKFTRNLSFIIFALFSPERADADWPLTGLPDEAQLAYSVVSRSDVFAFGPVGFAGETSAGELAVRILTRYRKAPAIFQLIAEQSTPAGQLYALAALHVLDRPAYVKARAKRSLKTKATVQVGCIGGNESMSAVVKRIDAGTYDSFIPTRSQRK